MKKELTYLGFVISQQGLSMDLDKVKVLQVWPIPTSATKIRIFHGLIRFYWKFI